MGPSHALTQRARHHALLTNKNKEKKTGAMMLEIHPVRRKTSHALTHHAQSRSRPRSSAGSAKVQSRVGEVQAWVQKSVEEVWSKAGYCKGEVITWTELRTYLLWTSRRGKRYGLLMMTGELMSRRPICCRRVSQRRDEGDDVNTPYKTPRLAGKE